MSIYSKCLIAVLPIVVHICWCIHNSTAHTSLVSLLCSQVLIERGVSYTSAMEKLSQDTSPGEGFYLSKRVGLMQTQSHCR